MNFPDQKRIPLMEQLRRKRAALYLRVSSELQTCDTQRHDLHQLAEARRFEVVATFEEVISGAAPSRCEFIRMKSAAHRGEFEVLLVWALDRLGRRGMVEAMQVVTDLDRAGVEVISLREPWLAMKGAARDLLVGVFGWVAEQERAQLSARTKAGIERARRSGKVIGRPRVEVDLDEARLLRSRGLSLRETARRLRVGASTLCRLLQLQEGLQGRGGGCSASAPSQARVTAG